MHVIAAKAICFKEALEDNFKTYQQQVVKNAQAMAKVIIDRGYEIISGGTENHLMLISLVKQEMTGKEADKWLGDAYITVNKNAVPNDPKSPFVTSGIRIGTAALTTRGFDEADVKDVAGWICDVLDSRGDEKVIADTREKVKTLCAKKPVYAKNQ
ncbi:MAG: serine hydroxymethyltransferase, partial [Psychrobacter sp.]|nr:serine hydroxymethyltransferase [Psychrobacter sp.]